MSGASASVSRMPRRISAWSSQRITWIMDRLYSLQRCPRRRVVTAVVGLVFQRRVVVAAVQRHRQDQRRAAAAAAQVDPATDRQRPLLQAADAEALRFGEVLARQA